MVKCRVTLGLHSRSAKFTCHSQTGVLTQQLSQRPQLKYSLPICRQIINNAGLRSSHRVARPRCHTFSAITSAVSRCALEYLVRVRSSFFCFFDAYLILHIVSHMLSILCACRRALPAIQRAAPSKVSCTGMVSRAS